MHLVNDEYDAGAILKQENSILKAIFHCNILVNLGTVTIGIIVTTFYFPCFWNFIIHGVFLVFFLLCQKFTKRTIIFN